MSVHLKKLSVGSVSIDNLKNWQNRALKQGRPIIHPTRNWPKRADELLDGGSIFWIIKGQMVVRQPITDLIEVKREDGRPACGIVLHPELISVWPTGSDFSGLALSGNRRCARRFATNRRYRAHASRAGCRITGTGSVMTGH